MHRKPTMMIAAVLAFFATCIARADVHPFLTDKFVFQAGAFLSHSDVDGSLDGDTPGDNPVVDFEEQFGLTRSEDLGAAEFAWRFAQNWWAQLQYFAPDRSATAVLEEDVAFGDAIFEQGSSVSAGTGYDLIRLFVGRNFSKREDMNYGIGAGVHRLDIELSLSGNVIVNGQPLINATRAAGAAAPLPNIGAWYAWSPTPEWFFGARVDWLDASVGDYSGGLLNAAIGLNYQVFKHLGVGAKYQAFGVDVDVDKESWQGGMDISYKGAYLYLSANWD